MSRHTFVIPMVLSIALLHPLGHTDKMSWKRPYQSCVVMGNSIPVKWCYVQHQWHHVVHLVKTTEMRCNMTVLVMWWCWHQCQHHMMLMALSMAPFCLLGQDNWNKANIVFFWSSDTGLGNMTLMASSIGPLHLLVQDNQNEMYLNLFSQLTLLVPTSTPCDANSTVNSTIIFIWSR